MGFFSDLKNDLTQAVNEMTDENAKAEMLAREEQMKLELSSMQQKEEEELISILEEENAPELPEENGVILEEPANISTSPNVSPEDFEHFFQQRSEQNADFGALEVRGTVLGNLEIPGDLYFAGDIHGRIKAGNIVFKDAKVNGNIESSNGVEIDGGCVIIGNVVARNAVIAGAVKGEIDVFGEVILESTAIVKGNIKSKSVQIKSGAMVEGMCSQCYAQISPSVFFEGMETEGRN